MDSSTWKAGDILYYPTLEYYCLALKRGFDYRVSKEWIRVALFTEKGVEERNIYSFALYKPK